MGSQKRGKSGGRFEGSLAIKKSDNDVETRPKANAKRTSSGKGEGRVSRTKNVPSIGDRGE